MLTAYDEFDAIAAQNRGFILRAASLACRRFVTESDDEWSVALSAFHEAYMTYDESRGSLRAYAGRIIRCRVIDYIRSEARHSRELAVGTFDSDEEDEKNSAALAARSAAARISDGVENPTRDEIEAMQGVLACYGFSFRDVADCAPKSTGTRASCARAVNALIDDPKLMSSLRRSRALPMKELSGASGVPRKILERHRKYLICAAEALSGDYPILSEYMRFIREAKR